jgi:hypothetical protein
MKATIFLASILLAITSSAQIPNYVPTTGLVGWWPFNGNANDESGNGNNGTVNGAILTSDRNGFANKSYEFNGLNNKISIPNSTSLNFSAFTISCWYNSNSFESTVLVKNNELNCTEYSFGIYHQASWNNLGPGLYTSHGTQNNCNTTNRFEHFGANNVVLNNQWVNIVFSINQNGLCKTFLNGNLIESYVANLLYTCNSPNSTFRIGGPSWGTNGGGFNGKIDDIGIWNRALSQCEIQDLYHAQLGFTSINAGSSQTVCSGDNVTLSATGASSYTWNNGVANAQPFNPTTTQDYIVTGVDSSGCIGTDTVSVVVLEPTFSTQTETACNSFTWIDGINYTTSNNTAIFNLVNSVGCDSVVTLNLTINNPSVGSQIETAIDSYTWPFNNQTYSQSGTYTDTIPNAVGCDSIVTLNLTMNFTGINELNQSKLIISPNPTNANFTITGLDKLGNVTAMVLKDLNGKTVKLLDPKASQFKITDLKSGVYFLTISAGEIQEVIKLIKE